MLSFMQAFKTATNLNKPSLPKESIPIMHSYNKVVCTEILASRPLPAFSHSAMDGFGFNTKDYPNSLKVVKSIYAGEDSSQLILQKNQAVKIMTGAMIPPGIDCIIPFEKANFDEKNALLHLSTPPKQGDNIRYEGEEIKPLSLIAKEGDLLDFGLIGLLAAQGFGKVDVYRDLKIALFSSGDELKQPGEIAKKHQIYDCNASSLFNALKTHKIDCDYLGVLNDDDSLEERVLKSTKDYDVIITTGGASMGDKDLFGKILEKNNAQVFCKKVNLKPGKPVLISQLNTCYIFCLPGNPISALCVLLSLIIPAIYALKHSFRFYPSAIKTRLESPIKLSPGRTNIILGNLNTSGFTPYNNGKINPNAISHVAQCNALAIFDENIQEVPKNADILVLRLDYSLCEESNFINT